MIFFHARYIVKHILRFSKVSQNLFCSFMHDYFRADNLRYVSVTINRQSLAETHMKLCHSPWTLANSWCGLLCDPSSHWSSSLLFLTSKNWKDWPNFVSMEFLTSLTIAIFFVFNIVISFLTLLLFDAPFETIRYCGFEWWNNCAQCWFPKWFWMVGQLIQNLAWIFPNGSTANTKPCLDTWINVVNQWTL